MKSKGFTLIELLAVIVILAIIALIATPIVLGIIEESRDNTNKVTAQYIIDAVEKTYNIAYTNNMGSTPSLEDIRNKFEMNGAEWKKVEKKDNDGNVEKDAQGNTIYVHKIVTPNDAVVCNINVVGTALTIVCDQFDPDIISSTMSISG